MDINIESGLTRMLIEVMVLSSRQPSPLICIIPRLRLGLLSLRSVLSSRQLFLCSLAFGSFATFKIYHG